MQNIFLQLVLNEIIWFFGDEIHILEFIEHFHVQLLHMEFEVKHTKHFLLTLCVSFFSVYEVCISVLLPNYDAQLKHVHYKLDFGGLLEFCI